VYGDELLPSRLALAARALRELTDALPKAVDVAIPVDPAQITNQVNILEPFWMDALKSACHQEGKWIGNIDEVVRTLLRELHQFFEWIRVNRPKRSEVEQQMFRKMDPYGSNAPRGLASLIGGCTYASI
jgi:hypothetical protein